MSDDDKPKPGDFFMGIDWAWDDKPRVDPVHQAARKRPSPLEAHFAQEIERRRYSDERSYFAPIGVDVVPPQHIAILETAAGAFVCEARVAAPLNTAYHDAIRLHERVFVFMTKRPGHPPVYREIAYAVVKEIVRP